MKRKLMLFLFAGCYFLSVMAQGESQQKKTFWSGAEESPFHLAIDLQTKYVWRGMEMLTEDSSPVVFPSMSYSKDGF